MERFADAKARDIVIFHLKQGGNRFGEIRGYRTDKLLFLQTEVYFQESTKELTLKLMGGKTYIEAKGFRYNNPSTEYDALKNLFGNMNIKHTPLQISRGSLESIFSEVLSTHLDTEIEVEEIFVV